MAEESRQFPDFCQPQNLFSVFVIAELMVLITQLAPSRLEALTWRDLALLSLFAQVTALWTASALCAMRVHFERMPLARALVLAYLMILLLVGLATIGAHWLDRSLALGAISAHMGIGRLLLGNLAVAALVAAAALRYFHVQLAWRAEIEAAAGARIQALQARIRPHFLFNALNSIASMTRRDPAVAEEAIEDLSDLFRASLTKSDGTWSLAEELAICRRFVSIEQLRLGDRLTVEWSVDDIPPGTRIATLMLQPLIENAIQHGVSQLRAGGVVCVHGSREGGLARITISNPLPRQPLAQRRGTGHALENIRQQLMLRFAGRARLSTAQDSDRFVATLEWPLVSQAGEPRP